MSRGYQWRTLVALAPKALQCANPANDASTALAPSSPRTYERYWYQRRISIAQLDPLLDGAQTMRMMPVPRQLQLVRVSAEDADIICASDRQPNLMLGGVQNLRTLQALS